MWFFSAWEIFGIILISLYLILSFFRQKPKQRSKQEGSRTLETAKLSDVDSDFRDDREKLGLNDKDSRREGFSVERLHEGASFQCVLQSSPSTSINAQAVDSELNDSNDELLVRRRIQHDKRDTNTSGSDTISHEIYSNEKASTSGISNESERNFTAALNEDNDVKNFKNLAEVVNETARSEEAPSLLTLQGDSFGIDEMGGKEKPFIAPVQHDLEGKQDLPEPVKSDTMSEDENRGFAISNFAENLVKDTTIMAVEAMQIHTTVYADDLSSDIVGAALDQFTCTEFQHSASLSSASSEEDQLECFVDELVTKVIDKAVGDTAEIKAFAQDLSDIILTEYAQDVISEVRETGTYESLGEHVASCVLDNAVREAGYMQGYGSSELETQIEREAEVNVIHEIAQDEDSSLEAVESIQDKVSNHNANYYSEQDTTESLETNSLLNSAGVDEAKEATVSPAENYIQESEHIIDAIAESKDSNEQLIDEALVETPSSISQQYAESSLEGLDSRDAPTTTFTLGSVDIVTEFIPDETGPPNQIKLRDKTVKKEGDGSGRLSWRDSLILDLEQEPGLEDSFESGPSDVGSPEHGLESPEKDLSDESDDFVDSEEDEIIDHAAEAQLGAVGGSNIPEEFNNNKKPDDNDYNDDDYDDDDDNHIFDPQLSVDGLCVSKPREKGRLKSVDSNYNRAIILDNGSGITKVGFAGDRVPRVIQPAIVGMPQRFSMHIGDSANIKDYKKYGDEAISKAGVMHLGYPLHAGRIDNWTDVVELWEYMLYDELGIGEGDHPIIVTEIAQNHQKNREKITEILFEQFSVPAMYLADQLALSLYASGMTSGISMSSGFSCTQAAVVYEGHTLNYTLQNLDIGGQQLTENLKLHLRDVRGHNFTSSSGWQIVNTIKEKIGYLSKDFVNEVNNYKTSEALTKYYQLPDGQMISVGYECISCMEPLFRPDTLMLVNDTIASQPPVHQLIARALNRCDPDLQDLVRHHVTISGGTSTAQGFLPRLQSELKRVEPRLKKLRAPEHRKYSPWIGGSILGSLSSFDNQYVTVDEYADSGARIVQRKCF